MSGGHPLVSIITVNYDQIEVTCSLLDSIRKISYPKLEVLLVDNGSGQNPEALISANYPEVKFIRSEKNLGFSGGNNLAIVQSKGDFLFFLNNDTELTEGCIEQLLEKFRIYKNLGAVSPMLLFHPEVRNGADDIIQYAGSTALNAFTARNRTIGENEKDIGQYDTCVLTPYLHGAAMMLKRETIERVGLMPEIYFLYYEELDWSEQIRAEGMEIRVEPKARVFHKESYSVGTASALKTFYLSRNRVLFMRRNRSGWPFYLFCLFLAFVTIPKNVLLHLIRGDVKLAKAFISGVIWHVKAKNKATVTMFKAISTNSVATKKAKI